MQCTIILTVALAMTVTSFSAIPLRFNASLNVLSGKLLHSPITTMSISLKRTNKDKKK